MTGFGRQGHPRALYCAGQRISTGGSPMAGAIFPNSQAHRKRTRLWMSALTLFPMLSASDFGARLPKLWRAIEAESLPSTRFYIEWFILLGLLTHKSSDNEQNLLGRLLEFEWATGTAISLITVAMHYGLKVEGKSKVSFFQKIFDRLLPWFLHNNHMVRLFALYAFDRLWTRRTNDS